MLDFLAPLFSSNEFMPHGHCYLWQPGVIWLHVTSDAIIALAYTTIPFTLLYFVRRRRDLPFHWIFRCFGVFVVACGATHYLEILTLWAPWYWLSGGVKAITAVASLLTAVLLVRLVPRALALPSPGDLRQATEALRVSEARFRAAMEAGLDAFFVMEAVRNPDGAILDFSVVEMNAAAASLMAQPDRAPPRASQRGRFGRHPELVAKHRRVIETRTPLDEEIEIDLRGAGRVWFHHQGQPGEDPLVDRLRDASTAIDDAGTGADRVRKIVAEVGRFARAKETDRAPIDLWDALESAIRLSSHHLQHHAVIVRDPGRVPRVLASTQGLEQIFINLLVNASQAMPEGRPQANRIHVKTRTDADGRAVVEIADTGAGITLEAQSRIFDPFFTTKPVGLGTGLGLSICHRIISDFGGTIIVESAVGAGALFRITLPAAPTEKLAPALASPKREGPTPRGQFLIVDDDAKVLAMLDRVLGHRHDVTLANDGAEALAIITAGRRFDLVLCDLMMPKMNGMDLYERVEKIAPEQASGFVFLCGGAVTQRATDFLDAHAGQRFDKPFQLHDLEAMIAERLTERD